MSPLLQPPLAATLTTGYGAWNPLVWLLVFVITLVLAILIRRLGEPGYKKDSDQTKPFMSGNETPDDHHIGASNLYWGYLEALKGYYEKLIPLHTGVATDYVLWMAGVLAVMLLIGLAQ